MRKLLVIPAYNEAVTIADVIESFYAQDPELEIIVVDNNSSDATAEIARKTLARLGAKGSLMSEPRQGKGMAVRSAFLKHDADVYIMVDADTTYHASDLDKLLVPVLEGRADMAVGNRHAHGDYAKENKRPYHGFGNTLVRNIIAFAFRAPLGDILSGYRVFSRRFVRSFPILYSGFQLETELTLHALDKRLSILEVPVIYTDRPEGTESKLSTFRDGARVLASIFNIFRYYRPGLFFGVWAALAALLGIAIGIPVIREYLLYRYIYAIPSAILASGLMVISLLFFAIALILDAGMQANRSAFEIALYRLEEDDARRGGGSGSGSD